MMLAARYVVLVPLLALVAGVPDAHAQRSLQERLEAATTIDCSYTAIATGNWADDGEPAFDTKDAKLSVSFFNVDTQEATADIDRAAGGAYYIVVRFVGNYLHLMQIKNEGPIYTTTIFAREVRPGRFMSMHSRHEFTEFSLPGFTSRPELYVGDCELGR